MNKRLITFLVATASIITLSSCRKKNPDLSSNVQKYSFPGSGYVGNDYFAVTNPLIKVAPGASSQISLDAYPGSYASKGLTFSSKDASIASVNELGVVTGVAKGVTDIIIKDSSQIEVGKVRVAVAELSSTTASKSVIDSISAAYTTSQKPTKMIQYEYSYEYYKKEGHVVYGMEDSEVTAYSYSPTGAYFYIEGPTVYIKTQGGAPEVAEGKWLFYTIMGGTYTRLIHITPYSKTYYDLPTGNYLDPELGYEQPMDRIMRDIMNFFFVSGEEILDNLLEDYEGSKNFAYVVKNQVDELYSIDSSSLIYTLSENGPDTASADDEINHFNIPAGTKYDYDFSELVLQQGTRCTGVDIEMEMKYKLGEENWSRVFNRKKIFDNTFEETKVQEPDKNGYKQVDNFYDL